MSRPAPAELAARATRGPRYTSYPPAPVFTDAFGEEDARDELAKLTVDDKAEGISLYAHIPFCRSLCWYCGCNVKVSRNRDRGRDYLETLLDEAELYRDALGICNLKELSLGGGSPNFLAPDSLEHLTETLLSLFPRTDSAVLGIELDPRDTTMEQVELLASLGYRRLSVGVQDFNEEVQKTINRIQSRDDTRKLVEHARAKGFTSVGIDLVYGLPGQCRESFSDTMRGIIEMRPNRLALFGYAHLPQLRKHQKLVERKPIPGLDLRAEILSRAIELLEEAGYCRVGFDHFALPDDPLAKSQRDGTLHRNFQGFTATSAVPLIALGVTGISDTGGAYWQNMADISQWKEAVEAGHLPIARGLRLEEEDELRRQLIYDLLCKSRVDLLELGSKYGIDPRSHFAPELERLEQEDMRELVRVEESRLIEPTKLGFELIRNVCKVFDPYSQHEPPRGSTTI